MRFFRDMEKLLPYVACFVGLILGVDNGGLQFVLLKIAHEFEMSEAAMGSLVTVQFGALTIAAIIAGFIADVVGKKKIACVAALLFTVSTFICFLRISGAVVVVGIFGCGAAFGALEVSVCAALSDAYGKKAGRYLLVMQGMLGLGSVLGPFATNFAMKIWGADWNILFLLCAVLFFIAFIFLLFTRFEIIMAGQNEDKEMHKFSIKNKVLIGLLFCALIYGGMETGIGSFIDTFFVTEINAPECSAVTLSLFWAAIGMVRLLAGVLYKHRKTILLMAYGVSGLLYVFLNFMDSGAETMAVTIGIGLFIGAILPTLVSIANERFPRSTGKMTSFVNAASGIGSSVSPPVVGMVAEAAGLGMAFIGLGVTAITGLVIYITVIYRTL